MCSLILFVSPVPVMKPGEGNALLMAKNFLSMTAHLILIDHGKHFHAMLISCAWVHQIKFAAKLPAAIGTRKMYLTEGIPFFSKNN
jgi:hypothetical protein